jgi:hypothetical protein
MDSRASSVSARRCQKCRTIDEAVRAMRPDDIATIVGVSFIAETHSRQSGHDIHEAVRALGSPCPTCEALRECSRRARSGAEGARAVPLHVFVPEHERATGHRVLGKRNPSGECPCAICAEEILLEHQSEEIVIDAQPRMIHRECRDGRRE